MLNRKHLKYSRVNSNLMYNKYTFNINWIKSIVMILKDIFIIACFYLFSNAMPVFKYPFSSNSLTVSAKPSQQPYITGSP